MKINTTNNTRTQLRPGVNYIPEVWEITNEKGRRIAVQLNGDGSLFVDWDAVADMIALYPITDPAGTTLHILRAMRDGNMAETPRDWTVPAQEGEAG